MEGEIKAPVSDYWRSDVWGDSREGPWVTLGKTRTIDSVEINNQDVDAAMKTIKTGKSYGTIGII